MQNVPLNFFRGVSRSTTTVVFNIGEPGKERQLTQWNYTLIINFIVQVQGQSMDFLHGPARIKPSLYHLRLQGSMMEKGTFNKNRTLFPEKAECNF